MSGLIQGIESRGARGSNRESGNRLTQALFGQMMGSSRRRSAPVVVNDEHLRNMIEMGFPEARCRRALRYFNNDFEAAI